MRVNAIAQWIARREMPAAPKPRWIIAAYFAVHFLYGVAMEVNRSDGTASLLELAYAGLGWLFITNVFFFPAPWIHESWLSPIIVIGIATAFVLAWIHLKGWIRVIALVALLLCANAYSFYAVMLTGG